MRGVERSLDSVVVTAVDPFRGPALDGKPFLDSSRPSLRSGHVVDHDRGQAAQAAAPGDRDSLVVRALIKFSVTKQGEDPGPFVLDVEVPYQEHVLPMIPSGGTVRDLIKE